MTRVRFQQEIADGLILYANREVEQFELDINGRSWVVLIWDGRLMVRHGPDGRQSVLLDVPLSQGAES